MSTVAFGRLGCQGDGVPAFLVLVATQQSMDIDLLGTYVLYDLVNEERGDTVIHE